MFDTDQFIELIHGKVALWDRSKKEYTDKEIREKSWNEIGEQLYKDWFEFDTEEKLEKVKEMKRIWRQIRVTFVKCLNRGQYGNPPRKSKKYIYADALEFLLTKVEEDKTSNNIKDDSEKDHTDDINEIEENDEENDEETETHRDKHTETSSSFQQCNITPFQQELLRSLNADANQKEIHEKSFLLSLLPDYLKLNDIEKFDFKLLTLEFFRNIEKMKISNYQITNSATYGNFQIEIPMKLTGRNTCANPFQLSFTSLKSFDNAPISTSKVQTSAPKISSKFCSEMYNACTSAFTDFLNHVFFFEICGLITFDLCNEFFDIL